MLRWLLALTVATVLVFATLLVACGSASSDSQDSGAPTDTGAETTDAGPFTCGSQTCAAGEVCFHASPGDGRPSTSCNAVPGCGPAPTCDCVTKTIGCGGGEGGCSADPEGHVTLECAFP